jgi:hypothetical protein
MWRSPVRLPICDLLSATKPFVGCSLNLVHEFFTEWCQESRVPWKSALRQLNFASGRRRIYIRKSHITEPILSEIRRRMSNSWEFCENRFTERLALLKGAHFTPDLDKIRYRIVLKTRFEKLCFFTSDHWKVLYIYIYIFRLQWNSVYDIWT